MGRIITGVVLVVCLAAIAVSAFESELESSIDAELDAGLSAWGKSKCASIVIPGVNYESEFARYCQKWGKLYKSETMAKRFALFKKSFNCIAARNARLTQPQTNSKAKGSRRYRLGLNAMSDHTAKEFTVKLGFRPYDLAPDAPLPSTVAAAQPRDWEDDGEGVAYEPLDNAALTAAAIATAAGTTAAVLEPAGTPLQALTNALGVATAQTDELLKGIRGMKRSVR